ncbi:MAG: hypothetical protein GWN00_20665 [Aliifodinibius sp.]|nr:hypothetical protein [Fodinibius sp.]NIY27134.1 hypothetical protein [Fodinibius sp.]
MQKINAAKEAKNWNEIEKLWKDLGKELEAPSDEMKMAGEEASIFLISAMREAVEDGAEYISFEAEDSDLFPTENGMAFIDANLVKNIYDLTLIAMSKDDEWEEVEMEDGADDSVFFGGEPW